MTTNIYFLAAGLLSLAWALLHLIAGGKSIARPLLQSKDLHDVPKYTQYYCWHIVSFVLLGMGLCFIVAAIYPSAKQIAIVASVLAGFLALFGLILAPIKGQRYSHMPQGWLFVPVFGIGCFGFL